jgi:hypothetical protein
LDAIAHGLARDLEQLGQWSDKAVDHRVVVRSTGALPEGQ